MAENEDVDEGPGAAYSNYVAMEFLLEKLKLLNYDQNFLKISSANKPLSKHYFAIQANSGEQFYMFTSICAWLIKQAGNAKFDAAQEHDDPNASVSNILDELRRLNIAADFPPNRLKTGSGEQCLHVLNTLADKALKNAQFSYQKATPVQEDHGEEVAADLDESELTAEQFEDEEPDMAEDEDDDDSFMDLEALKTLSQNPLAVTEEKKEILLSDASAAEWKLEVERVTPSLKIVLRADAKDWRGHLEQMQQHRTGIDEALQQTQSQLDRLATDIGKSMEKITSRERYLNSQLETLLSQFRQSQDRLAEVKEKYKEASVGVTERSRILQQVSDELDQVKQRMEERGSSLTDGAPLVKIKQALTKLRNELIAMDVQTAVIEQSLLQAQLRDRTYLRQNMHAAVQEFYY